MDPKAICDIADTASKVLPRTVAVADKLISLPGEFAYAMLMPFREFILYSEANFRAVSALLEPKVEAIPEEKRISPAPYVAVPALQAIGYSLESEELREMYANLLASAMNSDTANKVHPAFVEIIKQQTPSEARLLLSIKEKGRGIIALAGLRHQKRARHFSPALPPEYQFLNSGTWVSRHNHISPEGDLGDNTAIFSLIRLGLIEEVTDRYISSKIDDYRALAKKIDLKTFEEEHADYIKKYPENIFSFYSSYGKLTALADSFLAICT